MAHIQVGLNLLVGLSKFQCSVWLKAQCRISKKKLELWMAALIHNETRAASVTKPCLLLRGLRYCYVKNNFDHDCWLLERKKG